MRRARVSLRISMSSAIVAACASVSLILGAACGGGAASPTPTTASTVPSPAGVAPSPQRPALSSPVASPSAISTPTAGAEASSTGSGDTYEIQSGDTLLTVAEQAYGDATQWRKIYDANKDVIGPDPDKLKIGMKLKIPPKQ